MARKPKSRADGEGTIYEEAPGKWRGELYIEGRRIVRKGPTRKAVAAKLADLKKARDLRLKVADGRQTLTQWFAYWLDVVAPLEGLKLKTIESHRWACAHYILPYLGHILLCNLDEGHVERWLSTLLATPAQGRPGETLSPSTVRLALRRLRTALNLAVARRAIPENVAQRVKAPAGQGIEVGAEGDLGLYLEPDQIQTLLAYLREHRLFALYALAVTIGARQGELIGLRWSNVHLDAAEPHLVIREQLQRLKGEGGRRQLHRDTTKNKQSRQIPLSAELVAILRAHRARQAAERLILGEAWAGEDLVFTSTTGTPLDGSRLLRQFKAACARAGLPEVTFHSLRHSAGSVMLAEGCQIVDVSEVLGHSSPQVTAKVYAHSFKEGRQRAVEAASRVLLRVS
jgi:integrase